MPSQHVAMGMKGENGENTPFQPMSLDTSHLQVRWRSLLFGPFIRLTQAVLVVSDYAVGEKGVASAKGKLKNVLGLIVFLLAAIPLIYRAVFLLGKLNDTWLFSFNWAVNLFLALLTLHSFFSFVTLFILAKTGFFDEFTKKFLVVLRNKLPPGVPFLKTHIILGIFMSFVLFTHLFFAFENSTMFDHYVTNVEGNSTASYRHSMFGNQTLFCLDTVVIVWAALMSALALSVYNCVASSLATEYARFNEELKEAAKNGQLAHTDLLNNYGTRQLELLDLARFAFSHFGLLVTFTFMAGLVTHALAGFVMRGFGEDLPAFTKISMISFAVVSLFMLLADVKRTSDFAAQVDQTKNILLFERSIYTQLDEKLTQTANNIVFRIQNTHFLPTAFSSFKINEKFFQRAFLLFPFVIEFLNAHKRHVA